MSKYNNLTQRIIVALVGVAVIITACVWDKWGYFAIFFVITTFSLLEFYKLVGLDGLAPLKFWGTVTGLGIYVLTFLVGANIAPPSVYFIIPPLASVTFFIKLYKRERKPFTNIAYTFLGVVYVAVPFAMLNMSVFIKGVYHYPIIIGLLFLLWASDTGAFFAGTKFGKTKLFERVSPKKSWEGIVGAIIMAAGMAWVLSHFFIDIARWRWFAIAGIIIIAGTYGDLVESLFKRSIEIKDSGKSIPGHGGFLDRFDGLLLSAPFIVAFLKLF